MAPQTNLMACIMMPLRFKYTLSIETETRPDGPPPLILGPLRGTDSYIEQVKDIRHTHVCCHIKIDGVKKPIVETLPLPEVQPKCPPGWSAEDWDLRSIHGTTKYHFYISAFKPDGILAVKVANRTENDMWVYESINPTHVEKEAMDAMKEMYAWKRMEY